MLMEEFMAVVDAKGDLPVIPAILSRVLTIVRRDNSSARELASVILKDQALTTSLLRMANSSFYATAGKPAKSVSQAIVVTGFESVRDMAVGLSMFKLLRNRKMEDYLTLFWVHSVAVGVCAQALSKALKMQDTEEALVAGLLHDVGKLILLRYLPDEFSEVLLLADQGVPVPEAEEKVLQLRHQEVGEAVSLRWNLPEQIVRCIRHHHHFADFHKDEYLYLLSNVVTLSNIFAMHHYPSSAVPMRMPLDQFYELAKTYLDLDEPIVREVLKNLRRRITEYLDIFEIKAPHEAGAELDTLERVEDMAARAQAQIYALQQELKVKTAALRHVATISSAIIDGMPITELIEKILDSIQTCTSADAVALALVNRNRGRVDGVAGVGFGIRPIVKKLHLALDRKDNLISRAIHDLRPINVLDVESPIYCKVLSEWERSVWGAPAFTICPIVSKGVGVGAIIADRRASQKALADSDVDLIAIYADMVASAIERYRKESAAAEQAGSERRKLALAK
ncbi:MAG: HDOD domain-containing protein [Candidatus Sumerlaeota bacterium]|nr:HDOD domain-containing protein [Candidatus Sumerlaeota bacterium]